MKANVRAMKAESAWRLSEATFAVERADLLDAIKKMETQILSLNVVLLSTISLVAISSDRNDFVNGFGLGGT